MFSKSYSTPLIPRVLSSGESFLHKNLFAAHRNHSVNEMKSKIIITEKPKQITITKTWEIEVKNALFLMLNDKGVINQKQLEEVKKS